MAVTYTLGVSGVRVPESQRVMPISLPPRLERAGIEPAPLTLLHAAQPHLIGILSAKAMQSLTKRSS
jgi:hypothetical protein